MILETVTLPELRLAALQFAGPFSVLGLEMPKVWEVLLTREHELSNTTGVRYGVSMAERDGVMLENLAVLLPDLNTLPDGFVGLRIPSRKYASVTHRGLMNGVPATYLAAYVAIEKAGLKIDGLTWPLERYDERFTPTVDDPSSEGNAYDILIPLLE